MSLLEWCDLDIIKLLIVLREELRFHPTPILRFCPDLACTEAHRLKIKWEAAQFDTRRMVAYSVCVPETKTGLCDLKPWFVPDCFVGR